MKKMMVTLICTLLLLTGCSTTAVDGGSVKDITSKEAIEKIENKDSFILIVSLDTCPHCEDLKAMLTKTIKNHPTVIYRVELKSADEQLYSNVDELAKHLNDPKNIPHIYAIEKGKEKDGYAGYDEEAPDEFWDFVKTNGMENAK